MVYVRIFFHFRFEIMEIMLFECTSLCRGGKWTRFFFLNFRKKIDFGCILNDFERFSMNNSARTKFLRMVSDSVSVRVVRAIFSVGHPKSILVGIFLKVSEKRRKPIFQIEIRNKNMCPFATSIHVYRFFFIINSILDACVLGNSKAYWWKKL